MIAAGIKLWHYHMRFILADQDRNQLKGILVKGLFSVRVLKGVEMLLKSDVNLTNQSNFGIYGLRNGLFISVLLKQPP